MSMNTLKKRQRTTDVVSLLKAFTKKKDLCEGDRLHGYILTRRLLKEDCYVASALISLYAKCGALDRAAQLLDELPCRDVVSWNALIVGYVQYDQSDNALRCYQQMKHEGFSTNAATLICILKACGCIRAVDEGEQIHNEIEVKALLVSNAVIGCSLVSMYAKCGALEEAVCVHRTLSVQNVVSWSALINGYSQKGQGEEALYCFEQMQNEGFTPSTVTLINILKACASIGAADKGEQIHSEISKRFLLGEDIVLGNTLVDMYAKCCILSKASQVLDKIPVRNVVSWNALLTGYVQQRQAEEALKCFYHMQLEGISPDRVTFICCLKACSIIEAVEKGEQIHNNIEEQGFLVKDIVLGNTLLDMYAKCGVMTRALQVLDELPVRDVVSWNAVIAGYAQQEQDGATMMCFEMMQCEGLVPDSVTYICILKACGSIGATDKGEQIHKEIVLHRLLEKNIVLGNSLMDMYVKCGAISKAVQVLYELPIRNIVSWNTLIGGLVQQGHGEEVFDCIKQMHQQGISPDRVTLIAILKACGDIGAIDRGEKYHNEIVRQGLLMKDNALGNTLVDMYAKCGALTKAAQVLDKLPIQDLVTWNAIITGLTQQGQGEEALQYFERMQREGFLPDRVTFICVLKACGSMGAAFKGEQIYNEITRQGIFVNDVVLGNAVVDMYAKCGALHKAAHVLDELPVRDVVSWNALIAGLAQQGHSEAVLNCCERMQCEGISLDSFTFACLITVCSRVGLIDEGQMHFALMSKKYGIVPQVEHYTCMVDLFGRVGDFDKSLAIIKKMPSSYHLSVWLALLGACQECASVKFGRLAFDNAVEVENTDSAAYILMSKIYADVSMHGKSKKEKYRLQGVSAVDRVPCGKCAASASSLLI